MLFTIILEQLCQGKQFMYTFFLFKYRPKDSRMWNAMGNCYDKMDKKHEATKCYERAENCKDKEGNGYQFLKVIFKELHYIN